MVDRTVFTYIWVLFSLLACNVGDKERKNSVEWEMQPVFEKCDSVSIDTMDIENPFITYNRKTDSYYMTGDKGYVWRSKDLHVWIGPYNVLAQDTTSWLGAKPVIISPEIHRYANKYYYMATFETASHYSCATLVANDITGPYRTIDKESFLLDINEKAGYPTFCHDGNGAGYMIYDHLGEHRGDGTVQIIRYNDDFGRRLGEAYVMFKASKIPWTYKIENGEKVTSPTLESPHLFYSGDEGLGILFVACMGEEKAVGVAYSEMGTLNGPWIVDEKPLLMGFKSVSMFNDYDGTPVMLVSKDTIINGVDKTIPRLIKTDLQFEKLQIKGYYKF